MDDSTQDAGKQETGKLRVATPSLTAAIRKARVEQAEQSSVVAELRGAEMARLEMLRDALEPVLAQVPADVDLFDVGIVPGDRPRLFLDMIGYVEMAADRRAYRFVQDTRRGRVVLAETERLDPMVDACTNYIARRLVEREKALASDSLLNPVAPLEPSQTVKPVGGQTAKPVAGTAAVAPPAATAKPPSRLRSWAITTLMFLVEFLGSIALLVIAAGAGYFLWTIVENWWIATNGQIR